MADQQRLLDVPGPVCNGYVPAPGGAYYWCDECGWRFDYHADIGAGLRAMAERMGLVRGAA